MSTEVVAAVAPSTIVEDQPSSDPAPAPTSEVGSPVKKAKAKTSKSKASSKPRASYTEMINEAITTLKERTGSSQYPITKLIEDKHKSKLSSNFEKIVLLQLKKLTADALSICGMQYLVYIFCRFVFLGWILVTGTFILCGIFLSLHNVVGTTCVSMQEWPSKPHAHTALDAILPCVDVNAENDALVVESLVIFGFVAFVNKIISSVSNNDEIPHDAPIIYYNQSELSMPKLCNPYNLNLSKRTCATGEVNLKNASQSQR